MSATRNTGSRRNPACCWTCKLRRKKCDATQPTCLACSSRNITCHGYGERPTWLNGGDEERAELARIKDAVKDNKKRKRTDLNQDQTGESRRSSQRQATSADGQEVRHSRNDDVQVSHQTLQVAEQEQPLPASDEAPSQTPSLAPTPSATSYFRFGYHREAELLMHYLDHVFALQFRFHSPSVASGGRGWLLWLLTENKPLYHAALSLGALHQHSLLVRSARGQGYHDTLHELNEHHNRALQELQIFLQSSYDNPADAESGRMRRLQILACGVQLISFELFRGGTSQWQVHLSALAAVVHGTKVMKCTSDDQTTANNDEYSPGDSVSHLNGGLRINTLEDTAEHFLLGAVLWFDILSCASTSKEPHLYPEDTNLLHGRIDLANIAGCQSWIALVIGDIAILRAWKAEATSNYSLSFWKLFERGNPIRRCLEDGITNLRAEIDEAFNVLGLSHLGTAGAYLVLTNPELQQQAVKRAVTLVFAYAAQVYLNTTISGPDPKLDDVRKSVADTMNALQELQFICDAQALRSLIWPICIAGSMADDASSRSFFHGLIQGLGDEAHDFGNSATALQVMQQCWSSRDNDPTTFSDWTIAMDHLGQRVLLV